MGQLTGKSSATFFLSALVWLQLIAGSLAHEVRPTIADVTVEGDALTLDLSILLEAYIAGIDLGEVVDTNESPLSGDYDALRALSPAELEAEFTKFWPDMRDGFIIESGGVTIVPDLASVTGGEIGDIDFARESRVVITAALPDGDAPVTIGWAPRFGPLVIRQMSGTGEDQSNAYSGYLTEGQISEPIPRFGIVQESWGTSFLRYIAIGFEHIVPKGLDHILFVLGLFFLSMKLRPLLFQITAFTIAHTFTLALGILGIVKVNPAIVEPAIAASIVYVAVENIRSAKMSRWRPLVVFCFGLLHGLGFASVLGEIGLDPQRFVTGLIGFNIGVELGQLTVIALAFLAVGLWFGNKDWYRPRISNPASIMIALVGGWWFVERVFL